MKISELIKKKMSERGVSVQDIAEATGIGPQVIYNILNRKTKRPHLKTLRKVAAYLNEPVESFFVKDESGEVSEDYSHLLGILIDKIARVEEKVHALESNYVVGAPERDVSYSLKIEEPLKPTSSKAAEKKRKRLSNKYIRDGILLIRMENLSEAQIDSLYGFLEYFDELEKDKKKGS